MITTIYAVFIIVMNTVVQFMVSKKDIKLYSIIWFRDLISACIFIYIGMYWQLYIVAWQFAITITGYLCWKHEHETGVSINQIQLLKLFFSQFNNNKMATFFTHDCEVCKTETEQDVKLMATSLHIKCKVCGHKNTVPLNEQRQEEENRPTGSHKAG